jgi:acetyl-CoA carboxylase carboxyl transferase subunit alpha
VTTSGDKRERRKLARERLRRLQERAKQRELAAKTEIASTSSPASTATPADPPAVSARAAIQAADVSVAEKQRQRQQAIDALERDVAELGQLAEPTSATAGDISRIRKEVDELKRDFYANLASWRKVQLARHPQRPYADDFIRLLFADFSEIHGDRNFANDAAMVTGMARFHGNPCLVVGTQKGRGTKQRVARNFGQAKPEGYRKALRAMRLAAKFGRPIFVFLDTPGAYPGVGGEERGQAQAIAFSIREMARLPVPIIVTVTGEGGSGGALAIAVGDRVYMLENSIYSVISPEGCASIMWRDSTKAELAADALKITAPDLLGLKLIDEVVPEPEGGAHNDYEAAAKLLDPVLERALGELAALPPQQLIDRRYQKFRAMGQFFA